MENVYCPAEQTTHCTVKKTSPHTYFGMQNPDTAYSSLGARIQLSGVITNLV